LIILETGSDFLPMSDWAMILLFYASCCCWNGRSVPPCPAFFLLTWSLAKILLGSNRDPLDLHLLSS
jgi:hypothetical protein